MTGNWEYDGTEKVPKDVTRVVIKDGMKYIPGEAFDHCNQMIFVFIPDSVTCIGSGAFRYCTSLQSVHLPSSIDTIGRGAFFNCTSLISVDLFHLPLAEIRDGVFGCCTFLQTITFPSTLITIGDQAFQQCTSLTSLTLPPSLKKIGNRAFSGCSSITSLRLPTSMFNGCSNFYDCRSLISIQFHLPINWFSPDTLDFLVHLIGMNPKIAKKTCTDDLVWPLHFVLIHGWGYTWTDIVTIINAAPEALTFRDPTHDMFPFLLAACSPVYLKNHYNIGGLKYFECVYMLLRTAPWVLHFLIKPTVYEEKESEKYADLESDDGEKSKLPEKKPKEQNGVPKNGQENIR